MLARRLAGLVAGLLSAHAALAQSVASFTPDPATVQRYGPGYRYPQEGWIVLHIEGTPYERGVQHGRLMAPEIAAYLRCNAAMESAATPTDGWKLTRTLVSSVFLRGFDREYLEEMQGIADGASGAGARFDGRALDLIDIAGLNLWAELMTLDDANAASPTGLEGINFPETKAAPARPDPQGHCSAFAATGKATRDGHPVIGHITMFDLYPSGFYNVWLDVQPAKGHRVLMQSYPAGIYSGMDYYLNDAGIAMVETTIDQTRFDASGEPLASRARRALQYGDSIDSVVATLEEHNNGLYTNEWLLADMKTDEIAMLELGTHSHRLWRSKDGDWFGGTEGFYWGCNNTKDLGVRLETIPGVSDRPANMVWHPADRDMKWVELYRANVGRIDEQFAKTAFTTPPLCSSWSVDAKYTSYALAKDLRSMATFGPPLGQTWAVTPEDARKYKEVRPLVSNPWTVLGPGIATPDVQGTAAVDLHDPAGDSLVSAPDDDGPDKPPVTRPAWRGTILPASDGDLWLASAFSLYQSIVSTERGYAETQPDKCLCATDYDKVGTSLFAARADYFAGVREAGDVPLSKIHADFSSDAWFRIASGKGVLVLSELRRLMGDAEFCAMMDAFGTENAGKAVTSAQFAARAARASGRDLSAFFGYWLDGAGLPRLELTSVRKRPSLGPLDGDATTLHGVLAAQGGPLPPNVEVTVEDEAGDEMTQVVAVSPEGGFRVEAPGPIVRMIVDKYGRAARANGGEADLGAFGSDIGRTLIIYGTRDDSAANRDAAVACQKAIRTAWNNIDLPIKSDAEASESDLKNNHLILVGRPSTNSVTDRFRAAVPVAFGPASFTVRSDAYAHCNSTIMAAGVNPLNHRYSINVIAGNSGAATLAHAGDLISRNRGPEVRIFEASGRSVSIVAPGPELTKEFEPQGAAHARGE